MSRSIGPSLPPGYATRGGDGGGGSEEEEEGDKSVPGPSLPTAHSSSVVGPQLPPQLNIQPPQEEEEDDHVYGPPLPPGFGPSLPPGYNDQSPAHSDGDQDDEVIGPMPNATGLKDEDDVERAKVEIEARAQAMKDRLTGKNEPTAPQREEWMTILPKEFTPLGIGARKFRTKAPECGDRSVWTDTPADKQRRAEEIRTGRSSGQKEERKKKKKKEKEDEVMYASIAAREAALAKQVENHNKEHRSESLMEMHRKRQTKDGGKGDVSERRPFDRDTDLEAPRSLVTPAKRKALMKDSKTALNSKFCSGSQSSFL